MYSKDSRSYLRAYLKQTFEWKASKEKEKRYCCVCVHQLLFVTKSVMTK